MESTIAIEETWLQWLRKIVLNAKQLLNPNISKAILLEDYLLELNISWIQTRCRTNMAPSTVQLSTCKEEMVGHIFLRKGALSVTHPMLFSNLVVWVIGNIAQKINDTITLSLANSSKLSERTRNLSWRKSKVITRTVCTTPLIILEMPATKQSYAVINRHPSKLYPHNKLLAIN